MQQLLDTIRNVPAETYGQLLVYAWYVQIALLVCIPVRAFYARIHRGLEVIARGAVFFGGAALLLCAFMVTVDVLCRKFLSVTMSGSDEITGYVFASATTWGYSYCALHRANVRIDAVYNWIPRPARAVLDIVALVLLLWYMLYLTDAAIDVFVTSFQRDSVAITTLATPLWIPQLFWLTGLVLFVFTLTFLVIYCSVSLVARDVAGIQRLAGAMSVEEEIQEETHGIVEVRQSKPGG